MYARLNEVYECLFRRSQNIMGLRKTIGVCVKKNSFARVDTFLRIYQAINNFLSTYFNFSSVLYLGLFVVERIAV